MNNTEIAALEQHWRITRDGVLLKVKFKDMTENEREETSGRVFHMLWQDEVVLVPESQLRSHEHAAFRTAELASEFRLKDLEKDIEDTVKQLVYLRREMRDRIERNNKLKPDELAKLKVFMVKSGQLDRAEIPCEAFSNDDLAAMEAMYVRTMKYAELSPEQELQVRERLEKSAEAAFKNGFVVASSTDEVEEWSGDGEEYRVTFDSLQEAQEFFGLIECSEGPEE